MLKNLESQMIALYRLKWVQGWGEGEEDTPSVPLPMSKSLLSVVYMRYLKVSR